MDPVQLFGRLHPLVLHFPIALLLLAAAVEVLRCFRPDPRLGHLVVFLLAVAAAGALLTAATGWVFAHESHPEPELRATLLWHRWLGVGTAALALLAWLAARRWAADPRPCFRRISRGVTWLTAALLVVTAHLGALLVWGADYFS
ncbi:MAG: DUF2231 domain-containing protein [Verrucomicrobiota bacterium]